MVLIIGGYGKVGGLVCKWLDKAEKFIEKEGLTAVSRKVDVMHLKEDFKDIETVVMCVEQANEVVLQACLKYRVNYIDISPSQKIIEMVEKHEKEIEKANIAAVIGVGIAPGVSNLISFKRVIATSKNAYRKCRVCCEGDCTGEMQKYGSEKRILREWL